MAKNIFYRKADLTLPSQESLSTDALHPLINALIRKTFGEPPSDIDMLTMSTFHYVYRISVGPNDYILKISKYHDFKDTLTIENFVYREYVNDMGIGLKIYDFDVSCEKYPFPYIIMDRAKGRCLREIDFEDASFKSIVKNCGVALAKCHNKNIEVFNFGLVDAESLRVSGIPQGKFKSWQEYLYINLDHHLLYASDHKVINASELNRIKVLFEKCRGIVSECREVRLLHGDLGSHNIYVDTNTSNINAFVDWEDVLIGDPVFDVAMFISFFRMNEFLDIFKDGYNSVSELTEDGLPAKLWLYYLRIVVAKSVLRIKLGYDAAGQSKAVPKIKTAINNLEILLA